MDSLSLIENRFDFVGGTNKKEFAFDSISIKNYLFLTKKETILI